MFLCLSLAVGGLLLFQLVSSRRLSRGVGRQHDGFIRLHDCRLGMNDICTFRNVQPCSLLLRILYSLCKSCIFCCVANEATRLVPIITLVIFIIINQLIIMFQPIPGAYCVPFEIPGDVVGMSGRRCACIRAAGSPIGEIGLFDGNDRTSTASCSASTRSLILL